jgi:hypothetical protein
MTLTLQFAQHVELGSSYMYVHDLGSPAPSQNSL